MHSDDGLEKYLAVWTGYAQFSDIITEAQIYFVSPLSYTLSSQISLLFEGKDMKRNCHPKTHSYNDAILSIIRVFRERIKSADLWIYFRLHL